MRWFEGNSCGIHHSTDCQHFAATGLNTESLLYSESDAVRRRVESLRREGLIYLENLHIIEHQQQHARRLQMTYNLVDDSCSEKELLSAVTQLSGADPHGCHSTVSPQEQDLSSSTTREVSIKQHGTEDGDKRNEEYTFDKVTYVDGDERVQLVGLPLRIRIHMVFYKCSYQRLTAHRFV